VFSSAALLRETPRALWSGLFSATYPSNTIWLPSMCKRLHLQPFDRGRNYRLTLLFSGIYKRVGIRREICFNDSDT
jgi:hypothetical protein